MKEINVPLVLVGKALANTKYDQTNPWNKDLLQVHEKIKGNSNFQVLGFIPEEDIVMMYNLASVCVLPSLYEGFGLPVLEAMQCGCPVVTTKEGSLPEVAGGAAFYVDAYNTQSIGKGIKDVFSSSKLREELIKKGKAQAEKFSWKKTAQDTIKVYDLVFRS
jgi:glycosyltransferase involved in cell wall biosynthesis